MIRAFSIIAGVGVLALAAVAAGPILAQSGATAPTTRVEAAPEWISVGELAARLEAQGYRVREIEREDGAYEVEVVDANGFRMEARVDPTTGEILRSDDRRRRDNRR